MDFTLQDFFNLPADKRCKIALCKTDGSGGDPLINRWFLNGDVSYAYYYKNGRGKTFKIGDTCFGFVQIPNIKDKYLLVTAGRVLSTPDFGACEYEELKEFKKYVGRLFIRLHTGRQKMWCFNYFHFADKAFVEELIPSVYENSASWNPNELHLSYKELGECLNYSTGKMSEIRAFLSSVRGIYLLTDESNGKMYVGSASGISGVIGRWSNYKESKTGGNKKLIALLNEKGEHYFEKNITFTLLEWFGSNQTDKEILDRESYWKRVLNTNSVFGYNNN